MRIGLTYNLKEEWKLRRHPLGPLPEDVAEEFDTPETLQALARVFRKAGFQVALLGGGVDALQKVLKKPPDFVFNIAEGYRGRNREGELPSVFELLGIPYSGSDPLTLSATLDKSVAKRLVLQAGLKTADFWVVRHPADLAGLRLRFPLFVKPLWQGSSMGVRLTSKVMDRASLQRQVAWVWKNYGKDPVLLEEYIPGREITVGVLGNDPPYLLGMMEIGFQPGIRLPQKTDFIYSFEVKRDWKRLCRYTVPPSLPARIQKKIADAALRIYRALGCRDVARIDFRLRGKGDPYFLEANPLPGLSPSYGDLVIMARKLGWSYGRFILTILNHALARNGLLSSAGSAV